MQADDPVFGEGREIHIQYKVRRLKAEKRARVNILQCKTIHQVGCIYKGVERLGEGLCDAFGAPWQCFRHCWVHFGQMQARNFAK